MGKLNSSPSKKKPSQKKPSQKKPSKKKLPPSEKLNTNHNHPPSGGSGG